MSQNLNALPSTMAGASTPDGVGCSSCSIPVFSRNMTDAEREAAARIYTMTSRPVPIARRTPVAMYYRPAGQATDGTEELIRQPHVPGLAVQLTAPVGWGRVIFAGVFVAAAAGAEYALRRRG